MILLICWSLFLIPLMFMIFGIKNRNENLGFPMGIISLLSGLFGCLAICVTTTHSETKTTCKITSITRGKRFVNVEFNDQIISSSKYEIYSAPDSLLEVEKVIHKNHYSYPINTLYIIKTKTND